MDSDSVSSYEKVRGPFYFRCRYRYAATRADRRLRGLTRPPAAGLTVSGELAVTTCPYEARMSPVGRCALGALGRCT